MAVKKNILINTDSFGQNSIKKWNLVKSSFSGLNPVLCTSATISNCIAKELTQYDEIILGAGDGSLHHLINQFYFDSQKNPKTFKIGLIGLGSSCSFLKSHPNSKYIHNIPYLIDPDLSQVVDVGRVIIKSETSIQTKYFIANGSLGFLALGNLLFNSRKGLTQTFKKMSTELANIFVFFKGLSQYTPPLLKVNQSDYNKYLNIQFLKAKYYTGGYFFERQNSLQSGLIDFHIFNYRSRWQTLKVFLDLSVKNEHKGIDHLDYLSKSIHICSQSKIPIELDGEIYWGNEFTIECLTKQINIMG